MTEHVIRSATIDWSYDDHHHDEERSTVIACVLVSGTNVHPLYVYMYIYYIFISLIAKGAQFRDPETVSNEHWYLYDIWFRDTRVCLCVYSYVQKLLAASFCVCSAKAKFRHCAQRLLVASEIFFFSSFINIIFINNISSSAKQNEWQQENRGFH